MVWNCWIYKKFCSKFTVMGGNQTSGGHFDVTDIMAAQRVLHCTMYLAMHSFSLNLCSATIDLKHSALHCAAYCQRRSHLIAHVHIWPHTKIFFIFYLNLDIWPTLCNRACPKNIAVIRELTENIPNWAYYPHLDISNPQLGIIYPIGDREYMSLVTQSQKTNHLSPIGDIIPNWVLSSVSPLFI